MTEESPIDDRALDSLSVAPEAGNAGGSKDARQDAGQDRSIEKRLRKHPEMPDVPLILDEAKTSEQKQALDLALARLEFGRPFFMPPNVPPERVKAIRRAFDEAMKDKDLLAEADKLKIEIDPLTGEEVAGLIEQIYKTPAETVARVRDAMAPK